MKMFQIIILVIEYFVDSNGAFITKGLVLVLFWWEFGVFFVFGVFSFFFEVLKMVSFKVSGHNTSKCLTGSEVKHIKLITSLSRNILLINGIFYMKKWLC